MKCGAWKPIAGKWGECWATQDKKRRDCNGDVLKCDFRQHIQKEEKGERGGIMLRITAVFPKFVLSRYCPHCGAKMDGGEDNGNQELHI